MKTSLALLLVLANTVSGKTIRERLIEHREMGAGQVEHVPSLDALLEHDNRQLERLHNVLHERKRMLVEHRSGRRLLSDEQLESVTRQVRSFERKVVQLSTETLEEKMEKLAEATEGWASMQRIDYIDFDKTGLQG